LEFVLFLEDFTGNFSQLLFFLLPLLPLLLNDFSSLLFSLWCTCQHSRPSPSFISRDVPETQNHGLVIDIGLYLLLRADEKGEKLW
jgi:hypothetical protein